MRNHTAFLTKTAVALGASLLLGASSHAQDIGLGGLGGISIGGLGSGDPSVSANIGGDGGVSASVGASAGGGGVGAGVSASVGGDGGLGAVPAQMSVAAASAPMLRSAWVATRRASALGSAHRAHPERPARPLYLAGQQAAARSETAASRRAACSRGFPAPISSASAPDASKSRRTRTPTIATWSPCAACCNSRPCGSLTTNDEKGGFRAAFFAYWGGRPAVDRRCEAMQKQAACGLSSFS